MCILFSSFYQFPNVYFHIIYLVKLIPWQLCSPERSIVFLFKSDTLSTVCLWCFNVIYMNHGGGSVCNIQFRKLTEGEILERSIRQRKIIYSCYDTSTKGKSNDCLVQRLQGRKWSSSISDKTNLKCTGFEA